MSKWEGKYVIGLTGNIGTGKSVVRRMLEHLGAYGIDADTLSHRVVEKDAPGYQAVLSYFGKYILDENREIDRKKLARIVFSDQTALNELEQIIHPIVDQVIDIIIQRAKHDVVVIEAIKLIESGISESCDSLWVTYTPFETQLSRLIKNRKMAEDDARQRILAQPSQEEKIKFANVVIKNNGSFEQTWFQVAEAWKKYVPGQSLAAESQEDVQESSPGGELFVKRGKPKHSDQIALFINQLQKNGSKLTRDDIMTSFGEKAYLILQAGNNIIGVIGWQVENLIARVVDIYLEPGVEMNTALSKLISEMESASRELQCEASLIFTPEKLSQPAKVWKELGYESRSIESLKISAWKEAAAESMKSGRVMYFKQLRKDRILRPI